jgi:hypothetical protein
LDSLQLFSFKNIKLQLWALRISGAFCIAVFLFWASCHLFIPGAIKGLVEGYGKKIGYQISYQDLSISPLRLRIELDGLRLTDQNQNQLLTLKKSVVMLKWSSLMMGEISFDKLVFDSPSLSLIKASSKSKVAEWNWREFMAAVNTILPAEDPAQMKKSLRISADEFKIVSGSLLVSDPASQLEEEFKNFSIELFDIANFDKVGEVNGLRGQYGINLGALHFTLPGSSKKIAFKQATVKGSLDNSGPQALGAKINFELDEGFIRTQWDIKNDKSIVAKVQIENISIEPLFALLPVNKHLYVKSGVLHSDMTIDIKGGETLMSGDLRIFDLDVWELGQKQALLSWKTGEINHFSFLSSNASAYKLTVDELLVAQPVMRFEIDENGFSNFRRLFSKAATIDSIEKVDHASLDKKPTTESLFHFDMAVLRLRNGEVSFSDLAMRPHFNLDLKRFNASFLRVSNAPEKSAAIDLDGVVAQKGSMHAKGQIAFDDPRRNNNVTMTFRNLPLNVLNPPAMTFAGYQITGGRLNLNLNYQAKDGDLKGSNQIVIKKVELGEEVPDFQGKKLPLGLAIALLEDADDTIDITINIAGNVDSPEFSASGLIWQAISNVLTNVATAPFRALGALLGIGGNDGVNAILGEAVYLPADQDRLEKFGDFLAKKPHVTLELVGTYDPAQDKEALARAIADLAIWKAAGVFVASNDGVPPPNLSDPKNQEALRTAYVQYVGRIKLGQRLISLSDGEARNAQLRADLIASIPVTESDLKALAVKRAKSASELIAKNNPSLASRIVLGDVKQVSASKEGVPLQVELRIK